MQPDTIIIIILLLFIAIGITVLIIRLNKKDDGSGAIQFLQNQLGQLTTQQDEKFDRMQTSLREQQKALNEQLNHTNLSLQQQFSISRKAIQETSTTTAQIIKDVTEKLTKLDETNKQVVGFAEQLQSLENILKNPKRRGILGEYFLETVIKQVLPPEAYQMQYKFNGGEIVDALIKTREGSIPVDAKFSLENYNKAISSESKSDQEKYEKAFKQDLKGRIDETSKYILPEQGTLDFAFMFIPADGLYYELLVNRVGSVAVASQDLLDYAFTKRVIIVSPTTFYAYLQTVYQGLRALKIEESTKQIQANVAKLQTHLIKYEDYFTKVGKHLTTTVSAYNSASKELSKVDKDLIKITNDTSVSITTESLDEKPTIYGTE